MALRLSLDDDDTAWKVCDGGAHHRLHIEWSELDEHNLPYEKQIDYEFRIVTWFFLPPIALGKGTLRSSSRSRPWTDDMIVTAGHLLTRYVEVHVPGRQSPPNRRRFSLIPRASVWCSLSLVMVFLAAAAVLMATTLSTLYLELSYRHAVTGLGGLSLVALARMVFNTVGPDLRRHRPPFLGLGYVIGRTLVVCGIGTVLVAMVPTRCMTTVVNETNVEVELRLPSSAQPLILGPGQRVTFFGAIDMVSELLTGSLVGDARGRFCMTDDADDDDGEPDDREEECAPKSEGTAREVIEVDARLKPRILHVRCRRQYWKGLDLESAKSLGSTESPVVTSDAILPRGKEEHELALDDQCHPKVASKPSSVMLGRDGYAWSYFVEQPWRLDELRDADRLVVDATVHVRDAVKLYVTRPLDEATSAVEPSTRPQALDIQISRAAVTQPLPLPYPHGVAELSIQVGTPDSGGQVTQSEVRCTRTTVGVGSHFRLQQLRVSGPSSRLHELTAKGGAVPGWSSTWTNTAPGSGGVLAPWICSAALGGGSEGEVVAPTDLGDVELELKVAAPRREEQGWALWIPAVYVGRRIEIESSDGVVGSLTCSPSATAQAYVIGPLRVWEDAGRRSHALVSSMTVERKDETEPPGSRVRARGSKAWHSTWQLESGATPSDPDAFPPWTCRPVAEGEDGCLGCGQSTGDDRATAQLVLGRSGTLRNASADLANGRVTLLPVPPTPCFFDESYSRVQATCPAARRCDPAPPEQRNAINRDLGKKCELVIACPPQGARCPD